ncbi:hypothetical protein [Tsuneonella sp. HG222]
MLDRLTWRIGFIAASILAALLFVGFATQTIRIEGLSVWPFKIVGFKEEIRTIRLDLDSIKRAQETAALKAKQAKAEAEAEYRKKAEITDAKYKAELADARSRAARYADANRVRRQANGGSPGGPAAPGGSDAPEGADGRSEDAELVAVSREDFDILNENTIRLQQAHEWALGLNQR